MIYTPESYPQAKERFEYLIKNEKKFELRQIRSKRTLNQNNGYWLWLTYLEDETGYKKMTWHRFFLKTFPTMIEEELMGRQDMVQITTSDPEMNTARMSAYMNNIVTWCATELEIELPDLIAESTRQMFDHYAERGLL